MDTQNATPAGVTSAELEDLDTMLSGLDEVPEGEEHIEELIEEIDAATEEKEAVVEEELGDLVLDDETLRSVEADLSRQEAYATQKSEVEADASAPATAQATKSKKKPRKAAGSSTPRQTRDLASLNDGDFVLEGDVAAMSDDDKKAARTSTMQRVPTQKKIAEKFENFFLALGSGKLPSVYVTHAFKLLDAKRTITSTDLVAMFQQPGAKNDKEGYDEGTARSQTGQVMTLFDALKIATRTKQMLELNANSVQAERLRNAIAAETSQP